METTKSYLVNNKEFNITRSFAAVDVKDLIVGKLSPNQLSQESVTDPAFYGIMAPEVRMCARLGGIE